MMSLFPTMPQYKVSALFNLDRASRSTAGFLKPSSKETDETAALKPTDSLLRRPGVVGISMCSRSDITGTFPAYEDAKQAVITFQVSNGLWVRSQQDSSGWKLE